MKKMLLFFVALHTAEVYPQSDFEKVVNAGNLILTGISIIKSKKVEFPGVSEKADDSLAISELCVKNKLDEKITFRITGNDLEGKEIIHELVILSGGKECLFEVSKGVWTFEVLLADESVYRKGQYRLGRQKEITIR